MMAATSKADDAVALPSQARAAGRALAVRRRLPGAHVVATQPAREYPRAALAPKTLYPVRAYLDQVLGTIFATARLTRAENHLEIIANTVNAILCYNNIRFARVDISDTHMSLFEPIWFIVYAELNHLQLYVDDKFLESFVAHNYCTPVIMKSAGSIPLERLNPRHSETKLDQIWGSSQHETLKYAVVCDHVAQHIMHALLNARACDPARGLHEGWTDYEAFSLHAFLEIEMVVRQQEEAARLSRGLLFEPTVSLLSNVDMGLLDDPQQRDLLLL